MKNLKIVYTLLIGIVFALSACDNSEVPIIESGNYEVDFYYEVDNLYLTFNVEKGERSIEPIEPHKDGFVFEYWTLNSIEFSLSTIIDEDIDLYAKWVSAAEKEPLSNLVVIEDGLYTSKDEVALYITNFHKLPSNYMTKAEADGDIRYIWTKDNEASIGGDVFGNREGLLPSEVGRTFTELDIDYDGVSRGAKRIVFSSDFRIFYTDDHYDSFLEYDKETREWKSY